MKKEERIKKIMNQRANTSADIAEVLRLQEVHGEAMAAALDEQRVKVAKFMDEKWQSIGTVAEAAAGAEIAGLPVRPEDDGRQTAA